MARAVRELEESLVRAGASFVRYTGNGHKLYELESPATSRKRHVTLITHGLSARNVRNQTNQVKNLLKSHAKENPVPTPLSRQRELPMEEMTPPLTAADLAVGLETEQSSHYGNGNGHEPVSPAAPPAEEEGWRDVDESSDDLIAQLRCPECHAAGTERRFALPQGLGRHRAAMHAVKGTSRAATAAQELNAIKRERAAVPAAPPAPEAARGSIDPALAILERLVAELPAAIQSLRTEFNVVRTERNDLREKMRGLQTFLGVTDERKALPRAWER